MHSDSDDGERRSLKGGSFLDTRDGEDRDDRMKIRISTRIGRRKNFTAQNIGFRCVQSIKEKDVPKIPSQGYRVIRLRPPMHHHKDDKKSHFIHDKKDEL